jgi:hypothetical protein
MHLNIAPPILAFGGPYSNLRALAALRERAGELGIPPSQTICTGYVMAYCAEPEETTQAIRGWGCRDFPAGLLRHEASETRYVRIILRAKNASA